jgi:hypothetical protein
MSKGCVIYIRSANALRIHIYIDENVFEIDRPIIWYVSLERVTVYIGGLLNEHQLDVSGRLTGGNLMNMINIFDTMYSMCNSRVGTLIYDAP